MRRRASDEARLELAVERRVDGDAPEARHFLELVPVGEDAVEHVDCGVPGCLGHLAAAAIGEHAAVAAVLLRILVADTGLQRLSRPLEDRQQVLRLGHQLLEVARPAGHGVVQQQVLVGCASAVLWRSAQTWAAHACLPGAPARRCPQVIDPVAEVALAGQRQTGERHRLPAGAQALTHSLLIAIARLVTHGLTRDSTSTRSPCVRPSASYAARNVSDGNSSSRKRYRAKAPGLRSRSRLGAALLRRRLFRLFMGVFARGRSLFGSFCAGTAPRTAPTGLFRAASPA